MATTINAGSLFLAAASPRLLTAPNADIILKATSTIFHTNASGVSDTASTIISATLISLEGTVTFSCVGGTLSSVSGNTAVLAFTGMAGTKATVTATLTYRGVVFTDDIVISVVSDGSTGTNGTNGTNGASGSRGAGHFYATGTWTDAAANAATPGENVLDDVVTISDSTSVSEKKWTGSAWVDNGVVIDGNAIVNGSVTAVKVNANGLSIRKTDGTIILDAGTGLQAGFEAPGTKNSDIVLGAINRDPNFTDATAWEIVSNSSGGAPEFNGLATATGAGAPTFVYALNLVGTAEASLWLMDHLKYPIDASRVYEMSGRFFQEIGNNRNAYLALEFYTSADVRIASTTWGAALGGYPWTGVPAANSFNRYAGVFGAGTGKEIPSNATQCRVGVILNYGTGGSNLRMGVQEIRLIDYTAVNKAQTDATAAQAAADTANNALTNKLNKNADDILGGILSINAVTAPAGFRAGSLTWNAAGDRTGGSGTAMTPKGLVGYSAAGVATFAIDATTGNATFAGTVTAGALIGVTAAGTVESNAAAGGAANSTLANAPIVNAGADVSSSGTTGTRTVVTRTAAVTNGNGAITYEWSITILDNPNGGNVWISAGADTATATIKALCSVSGGFIVATASCRVTDTAGLTKTDSFALNINF